MTAADLDTGFAALLEKVERERGFACASYKHSCVRRRVKTRMRLRNCATYEAYLTILEREPREMDRFIDALTINVTRFFRNRPVWDRINELVVAQLWASELQEIRVWSAGCASGEEAVSLAILFHRLAAVNGMLSQINRVAVTGTDVDEQALHEARAGEYSEADLEEVPDELRERYFSAAEPFHPAAGIRRLITYLRHDLLTEAVPLPPQHLVICRNVLIYFERPVQEQVVKRLQDSLVPGGYLILGRVESLLGSTRRGFEPVAQRERIFRKVG